VILGRVALAPLVLALLVPLPAGAVPPDTRMVADQVEARGIEDQRVLDALRQVPRAAFVPSEARPRAHRDEPLPIGHGQVISQPYIVALMTDLLDVGPNQKVLEVGTGSGYQAAVLSLLAHDVYSIEIVPALAREARLRLTRLGYRNIHVKLGDGNFGWRQYGPYDRIIVTAAAPRVPEALVTQLAEGGVLVMPVGPSDGVQTLVRGVKRDGKLRARPVRKVRFVPLTGGVEPVTHKAAPRAVEPRGVSGDAARPDGPAVPREVDDAVSEEELSLPRRNDRRSHPAARDRAARAPDPRDGGRRAEWHRGVRAAGRCARGAG
jgi:protein-L-isoaspartate(D-aspartate) O-methyltransferase